MVVVVEGKNDKNKILSVFKDAFVVITNGSEISDETIQTIKSLNATNKIVLCLDPDGPGEKIRKKILENIPNCYNVYADKNKAISNNKKKVGIEHMTKQDILALFDNVYESNYEGKITYMDLYKLGLMESKQKRTKLCEKLHIGYCNAKQLVKRVNMLNISLERIVESL